MSILWLTILGLSIFGAAWSLRVNRRRASHADTHLLLYASVTLVFSAAACFAFLRILNNVPQTRHYLALLCLLAAAAESIIAILCRIYWVRVARLLVVVAMTSTLPFLVWPKIIERETNIDFLGESLQRYAGPHDLIVVNPWFLGPSFSWYYRGDTPWMTLPELREKRIHRYDLLKAKMEDPEPMADIQFAIYRTLESGHRVWVVGGAQPTEQELPLVLAPAPHSDFGWSSQPYVYAWSMQLAAFLQQHVAKGEAVIESTDGVSSNENIPVLVARGWRE